MAIRLMGCDKAVADPGFPQSEGCGGGGNIRFYQIFPKTAWF